MEHPIKNHKAPLSGAKTIKDIALEAGVSYTTVSRALNGKYGVHRKTRDRILSIARKMNYRPNAIARGLVSRKTYTIGLIVPDVTNPFFPEVAVIIEACANENNYNVFLCNSKWKEHEELKYMIALTERRVDGIIISPISSHTELLEHHSKSSGIPIVYVGNAPRKTDYPVVQIDNVQGGILATEHLLLQGFRTIGFVGGTRQSISALDRLHGYQITLEKNGISHNPDLVRMTGFSKSDGYAAIKHFIQHGNCPRAIFTHNDMIAIGAIQAADEYSLRIPEDLAIVGFDNISYASLYEVELTTVSQPENEMGSIAWELLMEQMDGIPRQYSPGLYDGRENHIVLEPKLIVRKTSIAGSSV